MSNNNALAFCALFGAVLSPSVASAQLNFVLNDTTPGGMDSSALAGFQAAANTWSTLLVDPVTVSLDIGFKTLDTGILGSTGSTSYVSSFADARNALIADATSTYDATAVASLPTGNTFDFLTNQSDTSGILFLDNNTSANNSYLDINQATAKAIGLYAGGGTDGQITFSDAFSWDFDASDGITPGSFDFVGVASHEIGHALGFVSGVDTVDIFSGSGPNTGSNLENFAVFSTLDLFRYSTDSLAAGTGVRDLSYAYDPYFSIDGGTTPLGDFSTGAYNGDGRQASHWQDNLSLGLMDPTLAFGEEAVITNLDLVAFDVMGWDLNPAILVPEPGTVAPFLLLVMMASLRRRRL